MHEVEDAVRVQAVMKPRGQRRQVCQREVLDTAAHELEMQHLELVCGMEIEHLHANSNVMLILFLVCLRT